MQKLRLVMKLNSISCLTFGTVFSLFSVPTSFFVSGVNDYSFVIMLIGIGLILNGFHLIFSSVRGPKKLEVIYFSIGDFLWVLATVLAIVAQYMLLTEQGIAASILVALMVGTFGYLQIKRLNFAS